MSPIWGSIGRLGLNNGYRYGDGSSCDVVVTPKPVSREATSQLYAAINGRAVLFAGDPV